MALVPKWLKIRIVNGLPFLITTVIAYSIIGSAWPSVVDQKTEEEFFRFYLMAGIPLVAWSVIALEGAFGIVHIRLGEKIFSKQSHENDENSNNLDTENEIRFKSRSIQYLYHGKKRPRIFFGFTILLNLINILLITLRESLIPNPGTWGSKIAGFLYGCGVVFNLFSIWILIPDGKLKIDTHPLFKIFTALMSWGYIISLPLTSISFFLAWMDKYDMLAEFPFLIGHPYFQIQNVAQIVGILLLILVGIVHTLVMPKTHRLKDANSKLTIFAIPVVFFRVLFGVIFIILLIGIFGVAHEHILVDELMLPSQLSHLIAPVGILFCFGALKSFSSKIFTGKVSRHLRKSIFVFGLITFALFSLPSISTRLYTNPSLHRQFDQNFGTDWERQIRDSSIQLSRRVPYSRFDANFGNEIPVNAKYNVTYMTDSPRYVKDRYTGIILSDGTTKYPSVTHELHFDAYLPAGKDFDVAFGDGQITETYPVIVMLHGYRLDRGLGNGNWTTQSLANLGYVVFDMSYGYTGMADAPYDGGRQDGYDYPDALHQIGTFTKYLENHSDYYHADLSNSYVAGRSYGGLVALSVGWLYDTPFLGSNFSTAVKFRGILSYYPCVELISLGPEGNFNGETLGLSPLIRGTNDSLSPEFNPAWQWCDPLWQLNQSSPGTLAPIMIIQGTHDNSIPWKSTKRLVAACKANGHIIIAAYYPFGGHACDGVHWSHYGQSVVYNAERFMTLCRLN